MEFPATVYSFTMNYHSMLWKTYHSCLLYFLDNHILSKITTQSQTKDQCQEPICADELGICSWKCDKNIGTKDATFTDISNAKRTGYSDVLTELTWYQRLTKVSPPNSLQSTASIYGSGIWMIAYYFCWMYLLLLLL